MKNNVENTVISQRRKLPRRRFLGCGLRMSVALPFLPSLDAVAQTVPKRFIAYYTPNGHNMGDFKLRQGAGSLQNLSRVLTPLDKLKDDLIVISGLRNRRGELPGIHSAGTMAFLTASSKNTKEPFRVANASMDQVAAKAIGQQTALASLQLGTQRGQSGGSCEFGYNCAALDVISWANQTTPLAHIYRPELAYDRLFSGIDPSESALEGQRRRAYRQSVLDSVRAQANSLALKLAQEDKQKLDQYLTGVRELEIKLENSASAMGGGGCAVGEAPQQTNRSAAETIRLMHEIITLAFQCDATRIVSFMQANGLSNRDHRFVGASGGHHSISHHKNRASDLEKMSLIGIWEMEMLADLLNRLKNTQDADGSSILQNTLLFCSSDCGESNRHRVDDMPVILAGQLKGEFNTGQHVVYSGSGRPWFGDLFRTILDGLDVPVNSFGDDGRRRLTDLIA